VELPGGNDGGDGGDGGSDHDGDGDPDPGNNNPVPDAEQRDYERLLKLVETIKQPANKQKAKLREPDAFDGSDTRKLRTFLALCQLNFRSLSKAFQDDESKVNYALSYLKGTALEWFEPSITDSDEEELWMSDWDEFVRQLKTNFGPADPVGDAEEGLDALRMRDGQRIAKYNVEFNRLAAVAKWGDAPLRHAYYKGLPDRIKDSLVHVEKPSNLDALRLAAQTIDICYWERRSEKNRDQPSKPDKNGSSDKSSDNKPANKKPSNGSGGKSSSGNNSHNNRQGGNNSSGNQKKGPDLSDKLGKDGKLTKEERQRRFDNNLCMFCGQAGHLAKDCPKSTSSSSKTKARAAKVDGAKTDGTKN
jgi:hypothetical protein